MAAQDKDFQDLDIFATGVDGSNFLLFGQGGNQVPSDPDRQDFQLKIDTLYSYLVDRFNRNDRFEIGDIHITQNSDNPSLKYGGTWAMIQKDTILLSGTSAEVGAGSVTPQGENNPAVPTPQHTHGATIGSTDLGTKTTKVGTGNHEHVIGFGGAGGSNYPVLSNGFGGYRSTEGGGAHGHDLEIGSHGHSVSVQNSGVSGATLDVRGQHIYVYIWKKTA